MVHTELDDQLACQCEHLTHFRVDLDPTKIAKKPTWTDVKAKNDVRLLAATTSYID